MIKIEMLKKWKKDFAPWLRDLQVEQDLIISRVLVEIYSSPIVRKSLAFRGGTALNKLFIQPPARYSEDIDLSQIIAEPIGPVINDMRNLLDPWLGKPKYTRSAFSVKLFYKFLSVEGIEAKLKIEINTQDHYQPGKLITKEFSVDSEWFKGSSEVTTYVLEDIMASKLQALYARRKGRDLFDAWYMFSKYKMDVPLLFDLFYKYCAHKEIYVSKKEFLANMKQKKGHIDFNTDMTKLLPQDSETWDFDTAYDFVIENVVKKLPK